jgi:hypothetical protein
MLIYTTITREDCPFPEQEYINPKYKYVCFHSIDVPQRKGWEYIKIKNEVSDRHTYSKYKILSHELFQEDCLVIDGKNVLTKNFYNNFEKEIQDYDSVLEAHNNVNCFFDELIEWLLFPTITYEEAVKILNFHVEQEYDFTIKEPVLSNFHYRKYTQKTIDHNKLWWEYWLRAKKRDQLWWYLSRYKINNKVNWVKGSLACTPKHQPLPENDYWKWKLTNLNKLPELVKLIKQKTNIDYQVKQWLLEHRIIGDTFYD